MKKQNLLPWLERGEIDRIDFEVECAADQSLF